jgi:hypothetical protein
VNWIHWHESRVQVWPVMNSNEPLSIIKGGEFLEVIDS